MKTIVDTFGSKQILKEIAPHSHFIDIVVRYNGETYSFEGDFLKQILPDIDFKLVDKEYQSTLENHKIS